MQSIESEIILHRCCRKIWEEGNQQIPVFTIHDSICTTIDNTNFVLNIIQQTLTDSIGILPNVEAKALTSNE